MLGCLMTFNDQCRPSWTICLSLTIVASLAINFVEVIPRTASAAPILRTVALSGQSASGTGGASFNAFDFPVINSSGHVAIRGFLNHDGVTTSTNDQGIWSESVGSLSLVIRTGVHAPGTPDGVNFAS